MTAEEFLHIAAAMQDRWWMAPIPDHALDQYLKDLRGFDAGAVEAAVAALGAAGMTRPPTSGQIHLQIARLQLDPPSWEEVRTVLRRHRDDADKRVASWECPHGMCEGNGFVIDDEKRTAYDCRCRQAMIAARKGLDALPPLVREFVAERHVDRAELTKLFDGDSTVAAQVRSRWEQFVGRAVESRVLGGLRAVPDLPRIEAARVEDERRGGSPRPIGAAVAGLIEGRAA